MLKIPPQLTFETAAKHFMAFCADRFPSENKLADMADAMGIGKNPALAIIVFSLIFRDGLHQVSLDKICKTPQERDNKLNIVLSYLETLEDKLMQKEEEQERIQAAKESNPSLLKASQ